MSKTLSAPTRRHPPARLMGGPTIDAVPSTEAVPAGVPATTRGGFAALLATATQEILAVTYWFNPVPRPEPYSVTIRFSGRRVTAKDRVQPGDRFVHEEIIEQVIPGSGPVSLTAKIHGITPGKWIVQARVLESAFPAHGSREVGNAPLTAGQGGLAVRLWGRWAPPADSGEPVKTRLLPFARVPGILPGAWALMVTLGILLALTLQFLVISIAHLKIDTAWLVTLAGIVAGVAGAKGWFIVLHRREHRFDGWCIQGLIAGVVVAAVIMLLVLRLPAGVFFDATAPGLLIAMAVGRVGCFFAGCCGGPPTASRWGVWSSDQRVGARRIPTQLLETLLALSLGLVVLLAVLGHGPADGAFFAASLAAYTLARQGILHLRAEPRQTKWGGPVTVALAALVLVAAVVRLVR